MAVSGASYFDKLSSGVSKDESNGQESDMCLASKMCFRTVLEQGTRTLRMGTVVRRRDANDSGGTHLVCVTPRCDCVRLIEEEESPFFFLPLVGARSGIVPAGPATTR